MTARDSLRRAVAAEFQRLDAHQCGYDHGFCADPDADPETAAFVDAAIRIALREAADFVRDAHFRDGLSVQEIGTALRFMADAATPTSKEQ